MRRTAGKVQAAGLIPATLVLAAFGFSSALMSAGLGRATVLLLMLAAGVAAGALRSRLRRRRF